MNVKREASEREKDKMGRGWEVSIAHAPSKRQARSTGPGKELQGGAGSCKYPYYVSVCMDDYDGAVVVNTT